MIVRRERPNEAVYGSSRGRDMIWLNFTPIVKESIQVSFQMQLAKDGRFVEGPPRLVIDGRIGIRL